MYDLALPVSACLRAGTHVDVAWLVGTEGFGTHDRAGALALTPGGGRIGGVLAGAADAQLADAAAAGGGRLVTLEVGDLEAQAAGLARGGTARCLLVAADQLPAGLWPLLLERAPVCLVSRLEGDRVVATTVHGADDLDAAGEEAARLFARGSSDAQVSGDTVVTVFQPVPKLVVVGGGPMADALVAQAELLGWQTGVTGEVSTATGLVAGLSALDAVVVMSHDVEVAGPALEAALATDAAYVAALGARPMQQLRADWLAMRGVTDLTRLHTPAGLDIGAAGPAEVALAVLAEALAARTGRPGTPLRDRSPDEGPRQGNP